MESSRKLALKKYDQAISYSTYWDDYYKDGYSKDAYTSQIDYKPIKKEIYKENSMPKHVKSVHVSMDNFINNQKYIEKLKNINTIIVETKNDEGSVLYASDVCKDYLSDPSQATNNAMISKKNLTKIIKEYKKRDSIV